MKNSTKFKYLWIALNFLLLALPVFVPSGSFDVIGYCLTLMIALSFPLAILGGLFFFYFFQIDGSIGSFYLLLFAFSILAYIQWFVLVPQLARFLRNKVFRKDLKISLNANVETIRALPETQTQFAASDFQKNWYDEQRRTPVERVIKNE